ncbi:MAG: hypothetical protein JRI97_09955, partial [Deltaproteobacteria bacterium]|nr:hypothetical protein [Deltaproteobacteria bacterium]
MEQEKKTQQRGFAPRFLAAVAAGMAACQVVAFAWVRASNLALLRRMEALSDAGYLTVPGPSVFPRLKGLSTPFFGGLFYTLSAGAGLGFLFALAGWACKKARLSFRASTLAAAPMLALVLAVVDSRGFSVPGTIMALASAGVSFLVAYRLARPGAWRATARQAGLFFLPLAVLAGAWGLHFSQTLFLNLRDGLLLSHPAGRAVNEFYYDYTMFPAETFKSFQQKLLHPTRAEGFGEGVPAALANGLAFRDCLPVGEGAPADLVLSPV